MPASATADAGCRECHRAKPPYTAGRCKACYMRLWRARRYPWPKLRCRVCKNLFIARPRYKRECSPECAGLRKVALDTRYQRSVGEEVIPTRDKAVRDALVRTALARGCRPVHKRMAGARVDYPFVAAWHRGGGLYVVRVRWPGGETVAGIG